jgi:thiol-disulfide isomerase/thioredoxin
MRSKLLFIFFCSINLMLNGQQIIEGYAPGFIGQEVRLYTYQDYLTMNRIEIGRGIVSPVDTMFRIEFSSHATIKAIVEIEQTEASLYISPGTDYSVYFPESEEVAGTYNAETNLYFFDLDTLDVNFLVLQYHNWFDAYLAYHETEIRNGQFLACLDTFKTYAISVYEKIDNPFFITYVRYDIAEMEQTKGGNSQSSKRLETYLAYIEPFPVYFENDRYMKFIRAFFDKDFGEYLPSTEEEIFKAIDKGSPTLLIQALRRDIFLAKPELRELVMIDKLGKAFYAEIDQQENILIILDSVSKHSLSPSNAAVAGNVRNYITKLEPGYPAPSLSIKGKSDELISWANYQGKFVYVNFFATWSDRSLKDMEIINKLVTKYSQDVAFISFCADKDSASFNAFMTEHPEYNWDVFYIGEEHPLNSAFNIANYPSYFLLDQDGFIFASPALAPSPNGKYESIDKTFYEINKALHPTTQPRVGER